MAYHGDPRPTHWTSSDGRVTPICDLADIHLRNILAKLEKRGVKAASEAVDAVFQADDPSPSQHLSAFPQQLIHDSLLTVVRAVAMVPMYRELLREAKTRFIVLDAVVQEQQQSTDPRMVTRAPPTPPETCPVTYTSRRSGKSARCVLPKGHPGKHTI